MKNDKKFDADTAVWGFSMESLQKIMEFKGGSEKTLLHGVFACDEQLLPNLKAELEEPMNNVWIKKLGRPELKDLVQDIKDFEKENDFTSQFTKRENA